MPLGLAAMYEVAPATYGAADDLVRPPPLLLLPLQASTSACCLPQRDERGGCGSWASLRSPALHPRLRSITAPPPRRGGTRWRDTVES
jgi:hypothetical protein